MYERAFTGIVTSWMRFGVVTLIGLLQTPILFRHLPLAELGVWYLFFSIATFINLSDLGLPSVFGRSIAYVWGRSQTEVIDAPLETPYYHKVAAGDLYLSALAATLAVSVAVSAAGYPIARLYLSGISQDPNVQEKMAWALACFLAGVVLNLSAAIPNACLNGYGDVAWDNATRIAANIFGFVLLVWLVPVYKDIRVLSLIYVAQGAFALLAGHVTMSRLHRDTAWTGGAISRTAIFKMYQEAGPIFVTRLGVWMVAETTLLLAGSFLGPAMVPDYAVLRQVVTMGMTVATAIPIGLAPYAAAAHAAGDPARVNLIFRKALRYSLIVTVLWTVGLLLWTPQVLDLWIGKGHFLGYGVLVPVVVACFLELHGATHGFFVWCVGKWPFAPVAVVAGVLNVLLAGWGCSRYGYEGLVWGSLLSQAATSYWYSVYWGLKLLAVSADIYLREIVWPTVRYLAVMLAAGAGIKELLHWRIMSSAPLLAGAWTLLGYTLLGVLATCATAAGLAWWLVLGNDDRADVRRLVKWPG